MRKKQNLIVKIAICGRKHPKQRTFFVGLLAVTIFCKVLGRTIRRSLKRASKIAVAAATLAAIICLNPFQMKDAGSTMVAYANQDTLEGAQSLRETVIKINDDDIALNASIQDTDSRNTISADADTIENEKQEIPWNLLLIDNDNPLPEGYTFTPATVKTGYDVDERIYADLTAMLDAGKQQGLKLLVCSAYRSYDRQVELFDSAYGEGLKNGLSEEQAYAEAATGYSLPGCSEHQAGLAVDIVAKSHQYLDDSYAQTAEAQWLYAHCAEYGFILRYPEGKEDITGIKYEPWHFRYVGVEAATTIMENGLTLEEYLEEYY